MFKIATLYKFVPLSNLIKLQQKLQKICQDLIGTLLIAPEGVNGTIAGQPDLLEQAISQIQAIDPLNNLWYQYSESTHRPFHRLKIRIKKEIITMAKAEVYPIKQSGCSILAQNWNDTLDNIDLLIDVRNDYEYRVGTFEGAVNPKTNCFSAFPEFVERNLTSYKDKPIAMFCTGGIRCEKASAYMLKIGFQEIYQLSGGVLQYLTHIKEEESRWKGECFVFDRRIALSHGLKKGSALLCYGCRMPLTSNDIDEHYIPHVQCKYCI